MLCAISVALPVPALKQVWAPSVLKYVKTEGKRYFLSLLRHLALLAFILLSSSILEPSWAHLGAVLGPSWVAKNMVKPDGKQAFSYNLKHLAPTLHVAVICKKHRKYRGKLHFYCAKGVPFRGCSGPSWGHLGPSWGFLGAILGLLWRSWGHLGPSWGHLGAIVDTSWYLVGSGISCFVALRRDYHFVVRRDFFVV